MSLNNCLAQITISFARNHSSGCRMIQPRKTKLWTCLYSVSHQRCPENLFIRLVCPYRRNLLKNYESRQLVQKRVQYGWYHSLTSYRGLENLANLWQFRQFRHLLLSLFETNAINTTHRVIISAPPKILHGNTLNLIFLRPIHDPVNVTAIMKSSHIKHQALIRLRVFGKVFDKHTSVCPALRVSLEAMPTKLKPSWIRPTLTITAWRNRSRNWCVLVQIRSLSPWKFAGYLNSFCGL